MPFALVFNRNRRAALEESPAFAHVAERFRRAGELQRAVSLCRDGLRRCPDHVSARVTLGLALVDLGNHADARKELKYALKLAPDNLAAIRGMAHLHDHGDSFHGEHDPGDQVPMDDFVPEPEPRRGPELARAPAPVVAVTMAPAPAVAPEPVINIEALLEQEMAQEPMPVVEDTFAPAPANLVESSSLREPVLEMEATLSVESMLEMEAALDREAALEMEAALAMELALEKEASPIVEPARARGGVCQADPAVAMELESLFDGPLALDELDPLLPAPLTAPAENLEHVDLLEVGLELAAEQRGPDDRDPGDIDPVVRAYREALPIRNLPRQRDAMAIGLELEIDSPPPESLPPYDVHALERFLNQVQTRRMLNA